MGERGYLRGMDEISQELGIVVRHFLEVGDEPAFIDGVAVEAASKLVVDAAAGHFFEGSFGHSEKMFFFGLLVALEDEVNGGRVGKFWGATEAAVLDVEKLGDGFDLGVDNAEVEIGAGAGEDFGLRNRVGKGVGGTLELGAFVAVGIGDGEKDAAETRAAHLVFWWEIGAAEKGFAVGEQKTGERPAALAGNGADRGLIARINVGALVAIHFYGDKVFVDDFGDFGVLVAFAVDDVAPVAPDGADIKEDGLVLGFGAGEGGVAPFVPVDGLVRGGAKIRAGGVFQAVFRMVGQGRSQFEISKNEQLRSFPAEPEPSVASLRMTAREKRRSEDR